MDEKPDPEAVEFPEWELLQNSYDPPDFTPQQLDSDSSPLIRHDYFSLHPNTIIPNSNSTSNSNSNSSTDPSEVDRNFDDSYVANQLFPGGELHLTKQHSTSPSSSTSSNPQVWNDSDSDTESKMTTVVAADTTIATTTSTITTTSEELLDVTGSGSGAVVEAEQSVEEEKEKEVEKRRVVWWKVPFEVFKYWVVRVSPVPVWSLSVAATAAFLGLVILGRRLYKMKRKTQTLKLNVALDDKKVSQLMGRVARLNEAFSVVRRVPIVRPSLPASSVTLRPVMSMR